VNIGNLKNRRIIGLPIEFATVVVISAMLVIYTSGWIAASGIENRVDSIQNTAFDTSTGSNNVLDNEIPIQTWERVALFICPLHQIPLN
tara:strand:+ start:1344 stop:1610 length:267 start_codon:yes stop_codon:yes gene_type:complete